MEEWEKWEVNDYMCEFICWQGDHKCCEKQEENELLGVDVNKIKYDYKNCVDDNSFKCEMCDFLSLDIKEVNNHFLGNHKEDYYIKCWECNEKTKTISELRKHVGTYHYTLQSKS